MPVYGKVPGFNYLYVTDDPDTVVVRLPAAGFTGLIGRSNEWIIRRDEGSSQASAEMIGLTPAWAAGKVMEAENEITRWKFPQLNREVFRGVGSTDAARQTMRDSYRKHLQLARMGMFPPPTPPEVSGGVITFFKDETPDHHVGLYGALATRYRARGLVRSDAQVWSELAPFLTMPEAEAVKALAEYIVYQERPEEADTRSLAAAINGSLRSTSDAQIGVFALAGFFSFRVPWSALIERDVQDLLGERFASYVESLEDDEADEWDDEDDDAG